jgi:hypothetical protein
LPDPVVLRIERFFQNEANDANTVEEQARLSQTLPPSLRIEVINFTHSIISNKIQFFKDKN